MQFSLRYISFIRNAIFCKKIVYIEFHIKIVFSLILTFILSFTEENIFIIKTFKEHINRIHKDVLTLTLRRFNKAKNFSNNFLFLKLLF